MRNKSKVLVLMLSAAALVAASVFGTLAYLTDEDTVTNTFTVGSVGLKLDEAIVNTAGEPLKEDKTVVDKDENGNYKVEDADRTDDTDNGNDYHLLPGHTYIKDPTVTIDEKSEESYVRMMVEVTFANKLTDTELATSLDSIFKDYDEAVWPRESKTVSEDGKKITYEFRYHTTVDGKSGVNKDGKLEPLFTAITVPGTYTNDTIKFLNGMEIVVTAHAIQADGFNNDEDAAWKAFGKQVNTNS